MPVGCLDCEGQAKGVRRKQGVDTGARVSVIYRGKVSSLLLTDWNISIGQMCR